TSPILLVAARRTNAAEVSIPGRVHTLQIGPLDPQGVGQILSELWGGVTVSPDAAWTITAVTEGNPLFTVELARAWRSEGRLKVEDGQLVLSDAGRSAARAQVAPTLQEVLTQRLATLRPARLHSRCRHTSPRVPRHC